MSSQSQALASVRNHSALLDSALYIADPSLPSFGTEFRISSSASPNELATLIQVCINLPRFARLVRTLPSYSSTRVVLR